MAEQLSIRARQVDYTDVDFSFRVNPATNGLLLKRGEEAVKQSVLNILLTARGEKPFQPTFGTRLRDLLFEPFDVALAAVIEEDIRVTLENFEPRIRVRDVTINDQPDRNALQVTVFGEIVSPEPAEIQIQFIVERLR